MALIVTVEAITAVWSRGRHGKWARSWARQKSHGQDPGHDLNSLGRNLGTAFFQLFLLKIGRTRLLEESFANSHFCCRKPTESRRSMILGCKISWIPIFRKFPGESGFCTEIPGFVRVLHENRKVMEISWAGTWARPKSHGQDPGHTKADFPCLPLEYLTSLCDIFHQMLLIFCFLLKIESYRQPFITL